jgi:hypothetical protein
MTATTGKVQLSVPTSSHTYLKGVRMTSRSDDLSRACRFLPSERTQQKPLSEPRSGFGIKRVGEGSEKIMVEAGFGFLSLLANSEKLVRIAVTD